MIRFESGQFPINAASKMAYVKAASALGRMDQVDIQVRHKSASRSKLKRNGVVFVCSCLPLHSCVRFGVVELAIHLVECSARRQGRYACAGGFEAR